MNHGRCRSLARIVLATLAAAAVSVGALLYVVLRRRTGASRPWWKKKRWVGTLALWVAVVYPVSSGPAAYCVVRGWCPAGLGNAAYAPLVLAVRPSPGLTRMFEDYVRWWIDLAQEHRYGP